MKIKTQSFILILGIAIMPALVISSFFLVERMSFTAREAKRYEMLKLEGQSASPDQRIERIVQQKPKGIDMAIADPSGRVVYSSIRSMPLGSDFAASLALASRTPSRDRMLTFGFIPPLPEGYSSIASLSRSEFLPSVVLIDFIKMGLLALAAILAFAAVMLIVIVRSIARSVLSLEAATRRVAAGELDLPISVEGSNEIASLSRSLNSLREEIKEDQARRARFIMGISHDLKTPLALVKGYAEALEEEIGGSGPGAASHLGIIQDKAEQLEGMIDDLIDFERVDTGEWIRGLADLDLSPFLKAFAKRVEADGALLGRNLRWAIDLPEPAPVRMDDRLVTRVLENLVNNALRYTAEGGRIELAARAEGGSFVVSIADDGPGIAPDEIPRIFEPFYKGSSSRREQGMGLGLSIVKTVVESHGWAIEVLPGLDRAGGGRGAAFVLRIARATPA
jgi:signal transduction histidine kinase